MAAGASGCRSASSWPGADQSTNDRFHFDFNFPNSNQLKQELRMRNDQRELNIHIQGPEWGDVDLVGQFLLKVAKISSMVKELAKDKEFARRTDRLDLKD